MEMFKKALEQNLQKKKYPTDTESCVEITQNTYRQSTAKIYTNMKQEMPYWWSDDIRELIKAVRQKRRKYQGSRRGTLTNDILRDEYDEVKKTLRKEIGKANKKQCGL